MHIPTKTTTHTMHIHNRCPWWKQVHIHADTLQLQEW